MPVICQHQMAIAIYDNREAVKAFAGRPAIARSYAMTPYVGR